MEHIKWGYESHRTKTASGAVSALLHEGGAEARFAYDLEYVDHLSFGLDLKILFLTVAKVVKRSGTLSGADQVVADFDEYRKKGGAG